MEVFEIRFNVGFVMWGRVWTARIWKNSISPPTMEQIDDTVRWGQSIVNAYVTAERTTPGSIAPTPGSIAEGISLRLNGATVEITTDFDAKGVVYYPEWP